MAQARSKRLAPVRVRAAGGVRTTPGARRRTCPDARSCRPTHARAAARPPAAPCPAPRRTLGESVSRSGSGDAAPARRRAGCIARPQRRYPRTRQRPSPAADRGERHRRDRNPLVASGIRNPGNSGDGGRKHVELVEDGAGDVVVDDGGVPAHLVAVGGDAVVEERAARLLAGGEVAHPGFNAVAGAEPEPDAFGGAFPADEGPGKQPPVLPHAFRAGIGGGGHVTGDRCRGGRLVHRRCSSCRCQALRPVATNPRLWTYVQSQEARRMKIGQVAADADVSVDTVRFYERRGVLPTPQRRPSGYREYAASTVERIRMARTLQHLGFTLDEVIDALHAHDSGTATCDSERWRLEAVVDRIDAKIAELRRTRRTVTTTIEECRAGRCRFTPALDADPPH